MANILEDLAAYWPGILLAYSALFVALTSPGPSVVAIMGSSLGAGRKAGLTMALGVAVGSLTWGVLTAAGLSALVTAYAWSLVILKVIGGLFLLWLAYKAFRSAASEQDVAAAVRGAASDRGSAHFLRGVGIHLTNPKAALAWIAIISLGLPVGAPLWVAVVIVGGGFLMSLAVNSSYALAFSTPLMVRVYAKARRGIQAVMGTVFALAGLRLLTSRA